LRQWRQSPDTGIDKTLAAIGRWWRRFAVGIVLMLTYVAWSWIWVAIASDPYRAYRYKQPEGLATVKVQFYAASDEPGEGLRRELLPDVGQFVYREYEPFLTNADLARANATIDTNGEPALSIVLTEDGAAKMRKTTRIHDGKRILLMIDGAPTTAPYVRGEIGDSLMITGNLTAEEIEKIARGAVGRK
jgi:hypothetical protein